MIYVTGDTHGDIKRFGRFRRRLFRRRDHLLICGDFGFVWDGSPQEKKTLAALEKLDCIILFVEGTHDNLDLLGGYPEEVYKGGRVRRVAKNVLWMQRGELFDLDGTTVFALGGGESPDADERTQGVNWWPGELPSPDELEYAKATLSRAANAVDIVVTHQNPRVELGLIDESRDRINALTAFLGGLSRSLRYGHWYFGGDHADRPVSWRMTAVFEKVLPHRPK